MKRLIILLCFLIATPCFAAGKWNGASITKFNGVSVTKVCNGLVSLAAAPACADSSCTGFLVCQNFEGTGYDNSETWTEAVGSEGTVDEDDTTATVLRGSQQLKIVAGSATSLTSSPQFTAQSTLWAHFVWKTPDTTPSNSDDLFYIYNTSSAICYIKLLTTGKYRIYHGSAYNSVASITTFADNTKYHIWVKYVKGAGSDGVATVWVSTTATFPGDENYDAIVTSGTSTTDAAKIYLMAGHSQTYFFDQIIARGTAIGDVCE